MAISRDSFYEGHLAEIYARLSIHKKAGGTTAQPACLVSVRAVQLAAAAA